MDQQWSSPKRIPARGLPPLRRNDDRGFSPRRDDGRLWPLRRNDQRPERPDERRPLRRWSEERGEVRKKSRGDRNEDRRTSPVRCVERLLSPRRVVDRRLSPRATEGRLSPEALSRLEASGLNFLQYSEMQC